MSYLLTEIALEMLGYKFYDIYGIQDEINNFQKHSSSERANNDANPHESLAHLLGINGNNHNNTTDRKLNQVNKEVSEEVNANLPETLTKLMDTEYNKIRQQVIRSKPALLETHNQNSIQSIIDKEHEKLRLEYQNLRNFRKIVEKNLLQINPATFEKYCQTFKPARKQVKRLDTNKK